MLIPGITSPRRAKGFTLIELMVVLVILGIVAGVIAPRLLSGASRSAEADVRKAAELISAAGRRDTLTSQQLAIDFDGTTFRLMVLHLPSAADAARGLPAEWIRDSLNMPVEIKDAKLVSVSADGAELDPRRFRVEFLQSGVRPAVLMVFSQLDDRSSWTVSLPTGAFRARIISGEDRLAALDQTTVDLDLAGRAEEPW